MYRRSSASDGSMITRPVQLQLNAGCCYVPTWVLDMLSMANSFFFFCELKQLYSIRRYRAIFNG
jgi:hypothetical protein